MNRLSFGPSLMIASLTYNRSGSSDSFASRALNSAFAIADLSVFSICFAACFFENASSASASLTYLPRI